MQLAAAKDVAVGCSAYGINSHFEGQDPSSVSALCPAPCDAGHRWRTFRLQSAEDPRETQSPPCRTSLSASAVLFPQEIEKKEAKIDAFLKSIGDYDPKIDSNRPEAFKYVRDKIEATRQETKRCEAELEEKVGA